MEIKKLFQGLQHTSAIPRVKVDEQSPVTDPEILLQIPVAFQGEPGAYSFEAARAYFKPKACLYPCSTFAAVCEAVVSGQTMYGVLPVANSQTGRMLEME